MKYYVRSISKIIILLFLFILPAGIQAEEQLQYVTMKMATLAPKMALGATEENADMISQMNKQFSFLEKRFHLKINIIGYYGGAMGNDPQMIQKAKLGQLDMLGTTLEGLKLCADNIDLLCLPYLIESYGQFDYIMNKNSAYINNLFFKNGWITMAGIMSEGRHDIYMTEPYRTPGDFKQNMKAANYTGLPDDLFYEAHSIPQLPLGMTDMYPAFRTRSSNAGIIPAMFVVGMQLYTSLKYVIDPQVRFPVSAAILTKRKWEELPWDFRVYMAVLEPVSYFFAAGAARDMSIAFRQALLKHGITELKLTPQELNAIKDPIIAYTKVYMDKHPEKKEFYDRIAGAAQEYNSGYPIERAIFESDPTYTAFYDRTRIIANAIRAYQSTGSKDAVLKLTKDKIIEKWRIYDMLENSEEYIKTGNPEKLKNWMKTFYITEVVDEMFSKHLDSVKKIFGTKQALKDRMEEFLLTVESPMYKGFQRMAALKEKEKAGLK